MNANNCSTLETPGGQWILYYRETMELVTIERLHSHTNTLRLKQTYSQANRAGDTRFFNKKPVYKKLDPSRPEN